MAAANPPNSVATALKWLKDRVGTSGWRRKCLEIYRRAWGWNTPTGGLPDAYDGWTQTKKRHKKDYNPPAGAPCWFRGPTPEGHVCMAIGVGDDVYTNDYPRPGLMNRSSIRAIEKGWDCEYLGWTEDYPRRGDLPLKGSSSGGALKVGDRARVNTKAGLRARFTPNGKIKTTVANGYPNARGAKITAIKKNVGGYDWAKFGVYWYATKFLKRVG